MMGDASGEAEAWASAGELEKKAKVCIFHDIVISPTGRQFIAAEELLFSARHASYWESLDAGVNCFMLAIEVGT